MTKLCKNCRFFQKYWADTQDTSTGECHRWPDAVATLPAHWCGEWKRLTHSAGAGRWANGDCDVLAAELATERHLRSVERESIDTFIRQIRGLQLRVQALEAALREAMKWDLLTDTELIPAEVSERLEALASSEKWVAK